MADSFGQPIIVQRGERYAICTLHDRSIEEYAKLGDIEADACLIASAPELLEALRLAQSSLSTYAATGAFTAGQPSGWLLSQLSAAIARAEGRP